VVPTFLRVILKIAPFAFDESYPEAGVMTVTDDAETEKEAVAAALAAGTFPSNPKPNAETTTSARRLKVVFVDIDFLSLVVKKTFFFTAGKERLFAS